MSAAMQTEKLQVHMTREEKALLAKLAEHEGRPMGNLIRWLATKHAEEIGLTAEEGAAA